MSAAPFVARNSPARVLLLLLGSAVFIALGYWLTDFPEGARRQPPPGLGWLTMLFFGFVFVVALSRLFTTGVHVRIDAAGIWLADHAPSLFKWDQLVAVWPAAAGRQELLCMALREPASHRVASPLTRWLARWNRTFGYGDVTVNLTGTDGRLDAMLDAIERFAPGLLREEAPRA